jgi:predicted NBD/HSP70 family sugar kinase
MSGKYVVGIDLGGTKVEACLMDSSRKVLSRYRVFSHPQKGLDRVLRNIENVYTAVAKDYQVEAIGMGTPGTHEPGEDVLYGSPHTPVYESPGFISRIRKQFNLPLVVENDANCLALAEYFGNYEETYSHVLAVIIGTGMGYGLILDKRLYRGKHGAAGEIGHTTIDYRGRKCECGRLGCAEAYLSGPSQCRRYHEVSGEKKSLQQIWELYRNGDPIAIDLFDESCEIMAQVFANVVNAFDLEAIILGGGVSNMPIWYEKVPPIMTRSFFGPPRGEIPVLKAKMGDSAGVLGAAYLALRELGEMSF